MRELVEDLKGIKLAIFDLDGVVYLGTSLIKNVDNIMQELKDLSIKVVYNSNNSTITRQMYVERLKGLNIPSDFSDFYTSASITAMEITKIRENSNIFVIGEVGLREELKAMGHNVIKRPSKSRYDDIDYVIVGLDLHFNYNNIAIAQRCILEGHAQFYATNADASLPVSDGLMPGAGVMVNAVETCTGKKPIKIFGKPQPHGIEMILNDLKIPANKAIIFGDRAETDILAGNRAGIMTAMVLTGVYSKEMVAELVENSKKSTSFEKDLIPNFTFNTLNDIFK
jgi:phosphoglycolate/pyridoxal phosphate phosphatase family enzyme